MTIKAVEAKKPINDDAMSAKVMDNKALTATLPNNKCTQQSITVFSDRIDDFGVALLRRTAAHDDLQTRLV